MADIRGDTRGDTRGDIRSDLQGNQTYADVLKEVVVSMKGLVQSEVALVSAEIKETAQVAGKHVTQGVLFGALLAISVLPFLAFLVIGLGDLLGGMYWLSSLIVAVLCAGIGGIMAYRAFKKITEHDLRLPATRASFNLEKDLAQNKVNDVKNAVKKGERYGSQQHQYT